MTLIAVFCTTHDESRPLQQSDASRHEPASVRVDIDMNMKHQMMHFTCDFTFVLTETFIIISSSFLLVCFCGIFNNRYLILRRLLAFNFSSISLFLFIFTLEHSLFILTESFSRFAALFLLNFEPILRGFYAALGSLLLLPPPVA